MGMLKRMLIPRSVRRATHPVRTVKRAVTPKPIKQVRRALNPVSNAKYGLERSLNTKPRKSKPTYTHAGCAVKHRSADAASKCRAGRPSPPKHTTPPTPPAPRSPATAPPPTQDATPATAPPKPSWRRHVPTLTAVAGTGRPVRLTRMTPDGTTEQTLVEILSVDGWIAVARDRARHSVEEYDLRTVQRID
jgi:hypothetical protein